MDDIRSYAIIMIYPDGTIESKKLDDRDFHMQYIVDLINTSPKLNKIVHDKGYYVPDNDEEIIATISQDIDANLAREGIVVFHNIFDERDNNEEYYDYHRCFYISMPSELLDEQKRVLKDIFANYDMRASWFGVLLDDRLTDTEYDEVINIMGNKLKN